MHRLLSHHEECLRGLSVERGHGALGALSGPVLGIQLHNGCPLVISQAAAQQDVYTRDHEPCKAQS